VGPQFDVPADPNSTTYVPRPEWYFLDFFRLLWYLQGQWEPAAIFFIIVLGVVLGLLPFYDRSPERHPLRRPKMACAMVALVAVFGLTYPGAHAPVSPAAVPASAAGGSTVTAGAQEFQTNGCAACHVVAGVGGAVGPNLTHIGAVRIRAQLEAPIVHGVGTMPAYPSLTPAALNARLDYLQSLK